MGDCLTAKKKMSSKKTELLFTLGIFTLAKCTLLCRNAVTGEEERVVGDVQTRKKHIEAQEIYIPI